LPAPEAAVIINKLPDMIFYLELFDILNLFAHLFNQHF
jgi:hypothetical protein